LLCNSSLVFLCSSLLCSSLKKAGSYLNSVLQLISWIIIDSWLKVLFKSSTKSL
jgi:hypothetical protein